MGLLSSLHSRSRLLHVRSKRASGFSTYGQFISPLNQSIHVFYLPTSVLQTFSPCKFQQCRFAKVHLWWWECKVSWRAFPQHFEDVRLFINVACNAKLGIQRQLVGSGKSSLHSARRMCNCFLACKRNSALVMSCPPVMAYEKSPAGTHTSRVEQMWWYTPRQMCTLIMYTRGKAK